MQYPYMLCDTAVRTSVLSYAIPFRAPTRGAPLRGVEHYMSFDFVGATPCGCPFCPLHAKILFNIFRADNIRPLYYGSFLTKYKFKVRFQNQCRPVRRRLNHILFYLRRLRRGLSANHLCRRAALNTLQSLSYRSYKQRL